MPRSVDGDLVSEGVGSSDVHSFDKLMDIESTRVK